MAQHFLLSAAARTLKLKDVYRMSDDEAFKAFAAIRFAETGGEAFCPECGCTVCNDNLDVRSTTRSMAGCQAS